MYAELWTLDAIHKTLLYKTEAMQDAEGELLLMGILGSWPRIHADSSPNASVVALINFRRGFH
jgi:hypothetical protein